MSATLSLRVDPALRAALQQRAVTLDKSISELVCEILREALMERPLGNRIGHLKGRLNLSTASVPERWHDQLRERNWRPGFR
jgi:hypothetical protein